jgi:hypothetical protein
VWVTNTDLIKGIRLYLAKAEESSQFTEAGVGDGRDVRCDVAVPVDALRVRYDPIPQRDRGYRARNDGDDRAVVTARSIADGAEWPAVGHSSKSAWDEGMMLASRRSRWRIVWHEPGQALRPPTPTRNGISDGSPGRGRKAPVRETTGLGQVSSWDGTDLRTRWNGVAFKSYSIIDTSRASWSATASWTVRSMRRPWRCRRRRAARREPPKCGARPVRAGDALVSARQLPRPARRNANPIMAPRQQ